MGNLDIFPVITPSDIVSISKLTPILKIICQSYANHIMTSLKKTITSVLKVLTYIIISIAAGLDLILVIMSVSIIKAAVILYSQTSVPRTRMGRIPWMARTDLKIRSIFSIFLSKKNLGASNSDGSNTMDGSNLFESPVNNKITSFTMPNSNKAI
jgi:uncharacterized membrane protein